jgi:non-specific serine/threonine protein kinase
VPCERDNVDVTEKGPDGGGVHLSTREREVVGLVAAGATDNEIAARLFISVRTVRSHLDRIRDKTDCRRRSDLTRLAFELDLEEMRLAGGDGEAPTGLGLQGSTNLPRALSSFVGRGAEVTEVKRQVGESRLVTLTGSGGAGKTRLALEVAHSLLDGSGEGVWLVELAGLGDPEAVPRAVVTALRIKDQPGRSGMDILMDVLADLSLLLVLDNCEHLIGACAKLAEGLLRSSREVHILATSREPLGIDGELVYKVPPLSLPPPDVEDLSDLEGSEAVALFVERAGARQTGLTMAHSSAAVVAGICRHLDGLPLAIELAVGRLPSMSVFEIHDRLDQRLRLLTGGRRTALPRQQTLAATIDWSYGLLNLPEQSVLRRLAVFPADFDLEAAELVGVIGEPETFEVADVLASLVDKSLLVADTSGPTARYRMLETVREYAAARLGQDDDIDLHTVCAAHATTYLGLAVEAGLQLRGPYRGQWVARLDKDYPNLRTAAEFLLSDAEGAQQVLRMFGTSRSYWWIVCTHDAEAIGLLDRALAFDMNSADSAERAAALLAKSYMLYSCDLGAQSLCAREALRFARRAGDPALEAEALGLVAYNAAFRGCPEEGLEAALQAEAIARQLREPVLLADVLVFNAALLKSIEADRAESMYREALSLVGLSGDTGTAILVHNDFADFLLFLERVDEAREHLELALEMAPAPGSRTRYVAIGNLGLVNVDQGDVSGATANFHDLIHQARRGGDLAMAGFAVMGLAYCATRQGNWERAATLHGGTNTLNDLLGGAEWQSTDQKYRDRYLAILHRELGASFDHSYSAGLSMSRAQILEYALAD